MILLPLGWFVIALLLNTSSLSRRAIEPVPVRLTSYLGSLIGTQTIATHFEHCPLRFRQMFFAIQTSGRDCIVGEGNVQSD